MKTSGVERDDKKLIQAVIAFQNRDRVKDLFGGFIAVSSKIKRVACPRKDKRDCGDNNSSQVEF